MMDAMDAELQRPADSYWDTVLEAEPSSATLLGDHRFDDRIDLPTCAARVGPDTVTAPPTSTKVLNARDQLTYGQVWR